MTIAVLDLIRTLMWIVSSCLMSMTFVHKGILFCTSNTPLLCRSMDVGWPFYDIDEIDMVCRGTAIDISDEPLG